MYVIFTQDLPSREPQNVRVVRNRKNFQYVNFLYVVSGFFSFRKKLPYVVTRDVCPSVCLSCRLSVRCL